MRSPQPPRHAVRLACCLLLLACRSGAVEVGTADDETVVAEPEASLSLDLTSRSLLQPIERELADAEEQKFVEIEITEIVNPKRIRISFELHYRRDGDTLLLGTFAPFPPDNPGRFLVATRGELRAEGFVELSLVVLDKVGPEDEVRVELKPLSFRKE